MRTKTSKYIGKFRIFATSRVASDTAILYVSGMIASGVGFISSVLVARHLGPADFAIIAGYNAIVVMLAGFTDFGLGTGLIRFASKHKNSKKANAYYSVVFKAELIIGALLLLFGLLFSGVINKVVGQALPLSTIRIAVIGGAITSVTAYVSAALAAHKKFKTNAAISITISVVKLVFVGLLLVTGALSVQSILLVYLGLSVLNAFLGFLLTPKDYMAKVDRADSIHATRELVKFSGWLTLTFFITSITGKLDFLYLYRIQGASAAGVYAAAQQLSIVYSMLVGSISTVATPYVSERIAYRDKIAFLKKSLPLAVLVACLFLVTILFVPLIINAVFGAKYAAAMQPLQILIIHLAINVLMIPISLLFIPMGKVRVGTFITLLQLAIALVCYPILITAFGAVGAAATVLITTTFGFVLYSLILAYLLQKERRAVHA